MRRADIIKRAGRNLRQAKGRTILTSLAIAVGAFTLTAALAAGQGTRDYAAKLLQNNVDPQAIFVVKDKSLFEQGGQTGLREYDPDVSTTATGRPGATLKQMNQQDVEYLESRGDLAQIVPVYTLNPKWVTIEGNDKKYIGSIDYYDATILNETKSGTLPPIGQQIADSDIVLPEKYIETLGITPDNALGKRVKVLFAQQGAQVNQQELQAALMRGGVDEAAKLVKPAEKEFEFVVKAAAKTSTMSFGSTPRMLVSANAAKMINDYQTAGSDAAGKYTGVSAVAKPGKNPDEIKKQLEAKGYAAQTAKDAQALLFTIANTLQGIVVGFGLLTLFASVFGIINTQYISVLERTSQIGLMKALGMSRRSIAALFRYEAAWIGFLGGAIGALVAYTVGTLMNPQISKWLDIGDNAILKFEPLHMIGLIAALVIIAIVAGWFPARKAARLDPIEALRTE